MSDEREFRTHAQLKAELDQRYAELLTDAEFTRGVLANSTEAILVLDLEGRIEFVSAGASRAMELAEPEALVGTPWLDLWSGEVRDAVHAALADAKAGRTRQFEGARRGRNGTPSWWEVTVSPIVGADGSATRLLAIARDVTERKLAHQAQQLMVQELHHRVKNTLAMAMGITSQSLARAQSIAEGRLAVEQRLMALAEAHNLLREGGSDNAELGQIVRRAIAPYDTVPSRFTVTGDRVPLGSQAALAAAMSMHELCTNAIKHGSLSARSGSVEVSWQLELDAGRLRFHWRERGGPPVRAPTRRGFGLRVIEAGFRDQLRGTVDLAFEPAGFVCGVDMPLPSGRNAVPSRDRASAT